MSDYFISFVPEKSEIDRPKSVGFKLIHWLVKEGIIVPELSDCTLGNLGYAPGENYQSILIQEDSRLVELNTNGVELFTERTVFHNGGYELDHVGCPNCQTHLIRTSWSSALDEWMEAIGPGLVHCEHCNRETSIVDLNFQPAWGFSNVGLTFWNWSGFRDSFVQDFEKRVGESIRIIHGKI